MKKLVSTLSLFLFLIACQQSEPTPNSSSSPKTNAKNIVNITGLWRGVLTSPGGALPFGIDISSDGKVLKAVILNGEEKADTSSVSFNSGEVIIEFDWYDARIIAKLDPMGNTMNGEWSKTAPGKNSKLPFTATKGYESRFVTSIHSSNDLNVNGDWKVTFKDEDGTSPAVAEFQQKGNKVTGTFLTPTGDYRYLEGSSHNNQIRLSTFDGAHAFLFNAVIKDGELHGNFWSRDSYHATWTAIPQEGAFSTLPNSWEMNQVTTDDQTVSFAFEDLNGKMTQLTDKRFKGKAVVVNLFGTWCPNCNDEAPVLAKFYEQYRSQGLEIVGLAFEFTDDKERDQKQIKAFKNKHNINYPLLHAGINDKAEATKVLGFLDKVIAYPTSIFLDRNHKVVSIHTGFTGPGTGEHYKKLVKELDAKIKEIINS